MNRKNLIFVGAIILVILLIIFGIIYLIWLGTTRTIRQNQIALVPNLNEKVFSPQYFPAQQDVYYFDQGLLNKFSFSDSKINKLYPDTIAYLRRAKFSPNGQKALLSIQEGDKYVYKSIDFKNQKITPLSDNIFDVEWLSNSEIIYTYFDPGTEKNSLDKANDTGQNFQKLIDLDFVNGLIVLSPDKKKVAIYPEPEGYGENFLTIYDFASSKLEKLDVKGIVGAVFSPDSQKIITNVYYNESDFTTTIFDLQTQKTKDLDFNTPLEKITWQDNENIVAAEAIEDSSDQFRLVNAKTGKSKIIRIQKDDKLFLDVQYVTSQNDKTVLFTTNDFLYKLELQ